MKQPRISRRAALAGFCGAAGLPCSAQGQRGPIELPARLRSDQRILVRVNINDRPAVWLLFDTGGAKYVYLGERTAAVLGVSPSSGGRSAGPMDSTQRMDKRASVSLDAGDIHFARQEVIVKDVGPFDGLIGAAVFAEYVVEIDLLTPAVRLHPPESFHYDGSGTAIPCDLWSYNPHVIGSLTLDDRGPIPARMTVDTGASGGAAFLTPNFDEKLRAMGRNLRWVPDRNGFATCSIPGIALGRFEMENAVVHLLPKQGFGNDPQAPDLSLAVDFLRRYRIFLDYTKRQVILEG
jgi:hypothetical protein